MVKSPKKETEAEIAKRRDAALMRALSMPHKPHKNKRTTKEKAPPK